MGGGGTKEDVFFLLRLRAGLRRQLKTPGMTASSGCDAGGGGGEEGRGGGGGATAAGPAAGHIGLDMEAVIRPQEIHIWPQAIHMPCSDTDPGRQSDDAESGECGTKVHDDAPAVTTAAAVPLPIRADDCIRNSC